MRTISQNEYDDLCSEVRCAGYEIMDRNNEGLTDFGEACRIASENNERVAGYFEFLSKEQKKQLEEEFNSEFDIVSKVSVKSGKVKFSVAIKPGDPEFWEKIIARYGSRKFDLSNK